MMNGRSGGLAYSSVVQQEWGRAHAEVAEDAERKASHGWGKMEEDVLPRRDTAQRKGWRGQLWLADPDFYVGDHNECALES